MTKPLISVVIDTYNHERFIEQAVSSAVEQDFPASDFEIVVVDDGSTDGTAEIVRKFAPRVRLISKRNGGQASAFNAAFAEMRGEIIALLDGDDWWLQGKLRTVARALEENPDVGAVGHAYYRSFDESGKQELVARAEQTRFDLASPESARAACMAWDFFIPSSLTVRREVIERVAPIPEELVVSADAPIAASAMAMKTLVIPEVLSCYRVHANNLYGVASEDAAKMRRRHQIDEKVYAATRPMLLKWGVRPECADALLDPIWIRSTRFRLQTLGGSRLTTFETEMRNFKYEFAKPSLGHLFFKYFVVGTATFLLSPRQFYSARDWYYRRNLGRLREQMFRTAA